MTTLPFAMRAFRLLRLLPLFAPLLLGNCGAPHPPQCRSVPFSSRVPTQSLLADAKRHWGILSNPAQKHRWQESTRAYNTAIGKLFDQLRCAPGNDWADRAASIGTRIAPAADAWVDPGSVDAVFPAAEVGVRPVKSRQTTDGLGLPVVGWRKTSPVGSPRERFLLPNGIPFNLTTLLQFDPAGAPQWKFVRRWSVDACTVGRAEHRLAADWTASNSFYWRMCSLDNLKLQNVFLPDRFTEETALYFVTPYDPEKIPVVFVHGLVSSPDAFKNLVNHLMPQPWFRKHYQIWLYNYPTGNPWLFSAMNFRRIMRETCAYARSKGDDRNLNRMVVVAHSMGGLVTRSSVSSPGTTMLDTCFRIPAGFPLLSQQSQTMIEGALSYQPLREPSRVVLMAVPHRGSPMANRFFSIWLSKLIRLPKTLTVELVDSTLTTIDGTLRGNRNGKLRLPTSIDSLSPSSCGIRALNRIPLPGKIAFHSIIGDRGRGDTPNSSDGVVPYASSHVEPVVSEAIVPSGHSVPDCPEAAAELQRILLDHLRHR